MLDVFDNDRAFLREDASGEASANRNPDPHFNFFFQTLRGPRDQFVAFGFEQKDGDCIDFQNFANALQRFSQHFLDGQVGQRSVCDALQRS